jgi:hypothetical protein
MFLLVVFLYFVPELFVIEKMHSLEIFKCQKAVFCILLKTLACLQACSACIHRGCCDRAYVILKSNEAEGRTIDIVRVLMFHALDPLVISEGEKSPGSELIEASARKLLSELVELSETPHDPALPKRTPKTPDKKERVVNFTGGILRENVEMKKGDWICTK